MDYIVNPIQVVQLFDLTEARVGDRTPLQTGPLMEENGYIDIHPDPDCAGKGCLVCELR